MQQKLLLNLKESESERKEMIPKEKKEQPTNDQRIEVFFDDPGLWFRGTVIKKAKSFWINYDDGDERFITNWANIKWRSAISNKKNKNGLKH